MLPQPIDAIRRRFMCKKKNIYDPETGVTIKIAPSDQTMTENTNSPHVSPGHEKLIRLISWLCIIAALILCGYHLVANVHPFYSEAQHYNIHLILVFTLIYFRALESDLKKGKRLPVVLDMLFLLGAWISCIYIHVNYLRMVNKVGLYTTKDVVIGTVLIVVTLDAATRTFGKVLPGIAIVCLIYLRIGRYMPGILFHKGFAFKRIVTSMTINMTGIYGTVLGISATILVIFMMFGGLLEATGGGKFFIDMALSIGGRSVSGPAQAAVLGSAMVGTVNGSAIANVATTGVFTIPLMKRCGYEPEMAGALEAVASSGGSLMPPVMGVGAFILSGITGIPYAKVALAAVIPAVLYYIVAGCSAHLYAKHHNFQKMDQKDIPSFTKTIKSGWFFFLPLLIIVLSMIRGLSAQRSGFYGIVTIVICYLVQGTLKNPRFILSKEFWNTLKKGLVSGAKSTVMVAPACAVMGIVSTSLVMSGLTTGLVMYIKQLTGGMSFLAVILTIVITLIFGMGVPTIASYVLVAVIGASSLIQLGFPVLSVHLLIYYYAIMANLTPPVCSAVLVASQIAEGNYMKTGFRALRIGITGFVLPLLFLYHPEMLLGLTEFSWSTISIVISCGIGLFSLVTFFEGYFMKASTFQERLAALVAGILLLIPETTTDLLGYLVFFTYAAWMYFCTHKLASGKNGTD